MNYSIAIIGTGQVGGTLARSWAQKGHRIHLGVRNADAFKGSHLLFDHIEGALQFRAFIARVQRGKVPF